MYTKTSNNKLCMGFVCGCMYASGILLSFVPLQSQLHGICMVAVLNFQLIIWSIYRQYIVHILPCNLQCTHYNGALVVMTMKVSVCKHSHMLLLPLLLLSITANVRKLITIAAITAMSSWNICEVKLNDSLTSPQLQQENLLGSVLCSPSHMSGRKNESISNNVETNAARTIGDSVKSNVLLKTLSMLFMSRSLRSNFVNFQLSKTGGKVFHCKLLSLKKSHINQIT